MKEKIGFQDIKKMFGKENERNTFGGNVYEKGLRNMELDFFFGGEGNQEHG